MTERLLDLSGRTDGLIPIFEDISRIAGSLGIPFFVIGATARDLILELGYGIRSFRATRDLDLAIQVENWEQYNILSAALLETGRFRKDRSPHSFIYKEEQYIDIIPFGQIQNSEGEITWPPENETSMSVIGFSEAYENTLRVRLRAEPVLDAKVASLPGLTALKLISWNDRRAGEDRDASDLAHIIKHYYQAGNEDRLFNEKYNIMEELDHRIEEAGARLLGHDIEAIVKQETKELILRILDEETDEAGQFKLATTMVGRSITFDRDLDKCKTLLIELKKGIYGTP
ncbi:MAG: nucleotidyl transferase AbiEii/AbiGii toxin family protein [Thermodesulfobacteriota bacterium]